MTEQMENAMNLPRLKDALKELNDQEAEKSSPEEQEELAESEDPTLEEIKNALNKTEELKHALANIPDSTEHGAHMDEIRTEAMQGYKDLLDMGFNVDPKSAGSFLEPSIQLLNLALQADNSKLEAKLKLMRANIDQERLKLQQQKLAFDMKKNSTEAEVLESDDALWTDRNTLLEKLRTTK